MFLDFSSCSCFCIALRKSMFVLIILICGFFEVRMSFNGCLSVGEELRLPIAEDALDEFDEEQAVSDF